MIDVSLNFFKSKQEQRLILCIPSGRTLSTGTDSVFSTYNSGGSTAGRRLQRSMFKVSNVIVLPAHFGNGWHGLA